MTTTDGRDDTDMMRSKRFTVTIPGELHARIKASSATADAFMGDVVRDLLEREFPEQRKSSTKSARAVTTEKVVRAVAT